MGAEVASNLPRARPVFGVPVDTGMVAHYPRRFDGACGMTKVTVREGETPDRAIKRFKRKVEQAGILKEVRKREHYLKPSVKAKLKARAAEARARKREKRLAMSQGGM